MQGVRLMNEMIDWARFYREAGWSVFPAGGGPDGKAPLVPWKDLQERASTADEVEEWWGMWPDAKIGTATGKRSGIVVLDADDGSAARAGKESWPDAPTSKTGRGVHFYFRHPGGRIRSQVKVKICGHTFDVRGDGGYVILPPSDHPTGGMYAWEGGPPDRDACPPLPDDVAQELRDDGGRKFRIKPSDASLPRPQPGSAYADAALASARDAVREAPEGQRNMTLNREAFSLGGLVGSGALPFTVVRDGLFEAAKAAGLGGREAWKTILSGLESGQEQPREIPQNGTGAGVAGRDLLPAREIIRRYMLRSVDQGGMGLVWRIRAGAYSELHGMVVHKNDIKDSEPPDVIREIKDWSIEVDKMERAVAVGAEKPAKLAGLPRRIWLRNCRSVYMMDVLPGLPEAPKDDDWAACGMTDREIRRKLEGLPDIQIRVQGLDGSPSRVTTLAAEAAAASSAGWRQVGTFRAWVKRNSGFSVRASTVKRVIPALENLTNRSIVKWLRKIFEVRIVRINYRGKKIRAYEISEVDDEMVCEAEMITGNGHFTVNAKKSGKG